MVLCLMMASSLSPAFAEESTAHSADGSMDAASAAAPDDAVNTAPINNDVAEGENEERPLVIAMAPLIDRTGGWMSRGLGTALMSRMDDELHVPLNDTMHWVTVMNEDDVGTALADVSEKLGRRASMNDVMKELATELHADLTLCLVVNTCYEREFLSWDWDRDMLVESVADLTLYGYDAKAGRPIKEHASRWERDEYHPSLAVEQLMMEALDEALRNANIKSVIFPLDRGKINADKNAATDKTDKDAKEKADGKDAKDSNDSKDSRDSNGAAEG